MVTASGAVTYAADTGSQSGTSGAAAPADLGNEQTFLKLLVAQIQNQNPLNPADGVQFVTQLAQFSELEQIMAIRQDVEALGGKAGNQTGQ